MLKKIIYLLLFIFLFTLKAAIAQSTQATNNNNQIYDNENEYLKKIIKINTDEIEILRRDQINYRIEKDLLKEAYSANYERINLSITLLLGLIGAFGIFATTRINSVNKDYRKELQELTALKVQFDTELKEVTRKQDKVQNQVDELSKDQVLTLQVMDIIERVINHLNMKNWQWALQWISQGLQIDPDNILLLDTKTHCLVQLGDYQGAAQVSKKLVGSSTDNPQHTKCVLNLLEILALLKDDDFNDYYQKYKDTISKDYNDNLIADFLRIFKFIIDNKLDEATKIISPFVSISSGETFVHAFESLWPLDIAKNLIPKLETPLQKKYLQIIIDFYSGKIHGNKVKEFLATQQSA